MARTIDLIALSVIIIIASFVLGAMLLKNVWLALIISTTISIAIVISIKFFAKQKYKVSPAHLATHFAIKGNEYVINLVASTLPDCGFEVEKSCIFHGKTAIFACYKFGMVSPQDIVSIMPQLEERNIQTVFLLANGIDKKAYQVASFLSLRLKLVKTTTLCRYLDKHNALPNIKKPKQKLSLKIIFETVFARANFKAYAFSGAVLLITSFITPFRIYYIVSGSICLLLAICTLFLGGGNTTSSNPFKQIENAVHRDCASNDNSKND